MRLILPKKSFYIFLIVLLFSIEGFSQTYTITGNVNSSDFTCSIFSGYTTISIGNGSTATTLTMNQDLDLIGSCSLGPIRMIINNATVDFSVANKRLTLPEGSSIEFINGGALSPNGGTGGGCTGNDRIYIGTKNIAACQGSSGVVDFDDINSLGGTGTAYSNSPVCVGSPINLTATPPPNGEFTYDWTNSNGFSSSLQNPTFTATSSSAGVYNVTMTRADGKKAYGQVTVTVNSLPTVAAIGGGATSVCVNSATPAFTNSTSGGTWSIINGTGTASITAGGVVTGLTAGSVTVVYTVSNGTCSNTVTKSLTVNSLPTQPTLSIITQPICSVATGSFTISNYNASYTYSATPSTGVTISGNSVTAPAGSYTITATSGSCTSVASSSVTLNAQPATPVQPTLSAVTQPTCSVSTGSFTISNYNGSYTYSATPSTGVTISGSTVTAPAGSYTITATLGSCSSIASSSVAVNAQPATPVQPTLSAVTQPTCSVSTGSFTISNYNGSYTYSATPSTGVTISGSTVTAPAGSYTIAATLESCSSVASTSVTVDAQPKPSAPIIGTITQPNCTLDTGSVVLSGLPSGTWTLTRSGTSSAIITGTGTSTTVSGLIDGGTYTFTVSNESGCTSVPSSVVNIDNISTITSTWNGSSWVNGPPDSSKKIVFSGNFSSTEDIVGCSCKVASGANVVINSGHTLKVTNALDVQVNGSITFMNNASLVQVNDVAVNTGEINYHRHTAPVKRYDFTYWSSPVVGQTLYNLSPNTLYDKYYSYNPSTGWVISYSGAATMTTGNGYLIRAPQTFSITDTAIDTNPVFIGKPNNGVVTLLSLAGNKAYLLGNPYPSAIDADKFIAENSAVLEGTLYFWTHNTSPSKDIAGNYTYNYTTNDYVTYNKTGGVNLASGKIAAGQGFFAPTKAAGNVVFKNSMRLSSTGAVLDNSQFFKLSTTSKSSTAATTEKSRIWLNLTNKGGAFKQTLVGYITGATNDYDAGYDGVSYDGNQYVDFYSVNQAKNLSIQGRALPFVKQDSVALGYKSTIKGEFQISIDHADGELTSQTVFLEDKVLNVLHDLRKEPYVFSTEVGRFNTRFVLRYVDKNAVNPVVDTPQADETVLVSVNNNEINVSSTEDLISKIIIYDVSGKILYQKEDVAANDFMVQYLLSSQQVLFVNVVLANGKTTSTKIIY